MGIKDIFKKRIEQTQGEKQSASEQYRDLLHSHAASADDKWSKTDEEQLLKLCEILGIKYEQAISDYEVVVKMLEEAKLHLTTKEVEASYLKAHENLEKVLADNQAQTLAMKTKTVQVVGIKENAFNTLQHTQSAQYRLANLNKQHPHLAKL